MQIVVHPDMGSLAGSLEGIVEFKKGKVTLIEGQAIPKMNIRAMGLDSILAVLEAAEEKDSAFILEVAASELGYIFDGFNAEYTAVALGAAIIQGYTGSMFFSGDHCQVKRAVYDEDPEADFTVTQKVIRSKLEAGHYSADLDTSTLASAVSECLQNKPESELSDEERQLLYEAQRANFESASRFTIYTRLLEAVLGLKEDGIQVALNGEVGEVGSGYIHPEELIQFLTGYENTLEEFKSFSAKEKIRHIDEAYGFFGFSEDERELVISQIDVIDFAGIGGMSTGVGTAPGGKKVRGEPWNWLQTPVINLELVARCCQICEEYGLTGPIIHGAYSLPGEEIGELPGHGAVAAHLATYLHDIILSYSDFTIAITSEMFQRICTEDEALYNKEIEIIDRERTKQSGQTEYKKVTMGTIIENIEEYIEAGRELTDEQRKQIAWIAHQARGRTTALRVFIDLKEDMWNIPDEIRVNLGQTVRDQVLTYMNLLNSQGTRGLIDDVDLSIPSVPLMPEELRDYLTQSPSVVSP